MPGHRAQMSPSIDAVISRIPMRTKKSAIDNRLLARRVSKSSILRPARQQPVNGREVVSGLVLRVPPGDDVHVDVDVGCVPEDLRDD